MRRYLQGLFRDAFKKGDMLLLLLCLFATAFGCLMIASATNHTGSMRYLVIQIGAAVIGVLAYAFFSSIDAEFFTEHRMAMVIFNSFLLFLLIPFGETIGGNRSWLDFPFLPFNIQPAEICKITFILILASVMASHQNRLSSVNSVVHMALHLGLLVGLNMILSRDAGVSLIFVFIFIGMAFAGGIHWIWFVIGGGAIVVGGPLYWAYIMDDYQKLRIKSLFDPSIDPNGIGVRYDIVRILRSLTGGGMTGQGLFQGNRTQQGALHSQHTDYIFSVIGEELGYIGCVLTVVLLALIVIRCIWVGRRSPEPMRRFICFGAAAAFSFQVLSNVGMCIGLTPVIGLTLPFISYGGSSIVTLFAMLGLVSGVYARPTSTSQERYIRPPQLRPYR